MKKQVLTIKEMTYLKSLGVDTSKASMVLLFFDESGNELGWEVEDRGKDKVLYEYYDEGKEIWESASYSYFDAETGHYDHSHREDCGVFTLQDMLEVMPKEIYLKSTNKHANLEIRITEGRTVIGYFVKNSYFHDSRIPAKIITDATILEAAYNMLCWLAENGYLGKEGKE